MDAVLPTTDISTPAPAAPVVTTPPAPIVQQPAAPMPAAATPPAQSGGGSNITDILKNLNWIEICFGILGTAALYYTVYYYRYNITATKMAKNETQNQIDELTIKLADMQSVLAEKKNAPVQQQAFS